MTEKRRFGRIPFGSAVNLLVDEQSLTAQLIDLSLKGAKIHLTQGPSLADETRCRFILALDCGVVLNFGAQIVHRTGEQLGLKFVESDPESFSHLLRLMELNTGDGEQIERELHSLGP
ncbi:PilZ domain-containing protein [Geoalkalibacter sp.]|uniref:PilZ domain-containing protein n=1 Tax=Geoalkalibacter sp. TaxID=3041440 RepID=UPI00272EC8DA|nr:PilZ domain-containing protein [Geoalkalibacter sp.]